MGSGIFWPVGWDGDWGSWEVNHGINFFYFFTFWFCELFSCFS